MPVAGPGAVNAARTLLRSFLAPLVTAGAIRTVSGVRCDALAAVR
ncbi:hypothetical protein ATKI12_5151 [Kitasatospora sp. Ki12]